MAGKDDIWYCGNSIEADLAGAYGAGLYPVLYDNRSILSKIHEKNDRVTVDFPYLRIGCWQIMIDKNK